jgi:hypothetical protein
MPEGAVSPLAAWESFYVIVGSSAAALTGLQFVVIALGVEAKALGGEREIRAFGTPTIVHFCAVLLISAIISAPWGALWQPALALGACGAAGLAYGVVIVKEARRQRGYRPVLEDWLWHVLFPLLAYAALLVAAAVFRRHPRASLFVVAAAAIVLLFTGIHNAWDAVTYMAMERRRKSEGQQQ